MFKKERERTECLASYLHTLIRAYFDWIFCTDNGIILEFAFYSIPMFLAPTKP